MSSQQSGGSGYGSFASAAPVASWLGGGGGNSSSTTTAAVNGTSAEDRMENGSYNGSGAPPAAAGPLSSVPSSGAAPASVLLFGLSANPPTGRMGHAGIVAFLAEQNQWDEIWVMPVYKHMHAKNSLLLDFEDRYQMCRLNFLPLDPAHGRANTNGSGGGGRRGGAGAASGKSRTRVRVVRLEKEVADHHVRRAAERGKGPETVKVGTIDVVVYARERLPGTSFALTLGTDTFNDIKKGKWKRGKELLELVSVVVVSRPGVPYTIHEEDLVNPRIMFYNVPTLGDISSTAVRKTTDLKLLRQALEPPVLQYICDRHLYAIGRLETGRRRGRRRRRVRWLILTTLLVSVSFLFAWRRYGLRGMESGLHSVLRAVRGLIRIEKEAT